MGIGYYDAVIEYRFENGEEIFFFQYRSPRGDRKSEVCIKDANGEEKEVSLPFSIFDEPKVCSTIGSLRQQWGYSWDNPYTHFVTINMNIASVGCHLLVNQFDMCYWGGDSEGCEPRRIEEAGHGSIRVALNVLLEMLNECTKRVWRMDDFM